jgi:iron complex outermembrane receptor protein
MFLVGIVLTRQVLSNEIKSNIDQHYYEEMVAIASGYLQSTTTSPSTVSVITSKDIERIGAITLEEVLGTIPGIHVNYDNGFSPSYNIRGVGSTTNSQVLIYLDGISINSSAISGSRLSLSHLVKNVERIEIIKGPGSALYGADAFSGVINIISKKNIGTDIGTFAGSFDTFGGWLNHGNEFDKFKINFSAQGRTTKGSKGIIKEDGQSQIDKMLGTNISLAPGPINRGHDDIDIKLEAHYEDTANIYLRYVHNTDYGMGVGLAGSLDNSGKTISDAWITGVKVKFGPEKWKTTFIANYTGYVGSAQQNIFPSGAFRGLFKTPVTQQFDQTAHNFTINISTIYEKKDNHKFHVGSGIDYDSITDITDERNFQKGPFNILLPTGSLQSTRELGELPIVFPEERYNYYGFIHDEWQILNDLILTAGVRVDYFSDFGLTVNPRASLAWNLSSSLTTKLMYGRAFRAPSFFELKTNPGLTVTGNPNLDPETMEMVELSIIKKWRPDLNTQLNLFWYKIDDLITETKNQDRLSQSENRIFNNTDGANTYGLETKLFYQLFKNLNLNINYTYLQINAESTTNDQFIITSPKHQVYAEVNWSFLPSWSANLRSTTILRRKRATKDVRNSIKDYTQLDFTLSGVNVVKNMDMTFKINNLLDANVRDPSLDGSAIPFDYPLDGRSFMGILSMKF